MNQSFKGVKHQRGFIGMGLIGGAIVGAIGGVIKGVGEAKAANQKQKQDYADAAMLSQLKLQEDSWLAQQQRKWNLEDYARAQNYKEDAIRRFAGSAPKNVLTEDGAWGAPPPRTAVDTSGLAQVQANGMPYIVNPKDQLPMVSAPSATLPGVG